MVQDSASTVWFLLVKCRALPGSEFPGSPDAAIYVEYYVPAADSSDAVSLATDHLLGEGYRIVEVEDCSSLDLEDWDYDAYPETSEARELCERVLRCRELEHGAFFYSDP